MIRPTRKTRWLYTALIGAVALERLAELVITKRNTAWSLSQGGVEHGQGHYPAMVVLHTGLLAGAVWEAWRRRKPFSRGLAASALAVVAGSQALRWWVIGTLGRQWNTRVLVVPGSPRIRRGPYRFLDHPNYVAVVAEGLALPLVHNGRRTAAVFSLANAVLLHTRLRCENAALAALDDRPVDEASCLGEATPPATLSRADYANQDVR